MQPKTLYFFFPFLPQNTLWRTSNPGSALSLTSHNSMMLSSTASLTSAAPLVMFIRAVAMTAAALATRILPRAVKLISRLWLWHYFHLRGCLISNCITTPCPGNVHKRVPCPPLLFVYCLHGIDRTCLSTLCKLLLCIMASFFFASSLLSNLCLLSSSNVNTLHLIGTIMDVPVCGICCHKSEINQ